MQSGGKIGIHSRQSGQLGGAATTAGNTLAVQPSRKFAPGEVVTVTVPAGLPSTNGTASTTGFVYEFTAAAEDGTGTYAPYYKITAGETPSVMAVADVDADGDLDLLAGRTSSTATNSITVALNEGDGTFTRSFTVLTTSSTRSITMADLNQDGSPDMVVTSSGQPYVTALLNDGRGRFGAAMPLPVTDFTRNTKAADVDADGDIDVLVITSESSFSTSQLVTILKNNGRGGFSAGSSILIKMAGFSDLDILPADADEDGDIDFLASSGTNYRPEFWLNDGQGNFSTGASFLFSPYSVWLFKALDVDHDGDLDYLLGTGSAPGTISLFRSNGGGKFAPEQKVAVVDNMRTLDTGDVDGDGDLDFVVSGNDALLVYHNDGTGQFSRGASLPADASGHSVLLADLDQDQDLDIVALQQTIGTAFKLFRNINRSTGPALQVMGTRPAPNGLHVPVQGALQVTFNQALSQASSTRSAVKLLGQRVGQAQVPGTVTDSVLTLRPTVPFSAGEQVSMTVTTAARSSHNAPLLTPFVYQFTAATQPSPGTFTGGTQLDGTGLYGLGAQKTYVSAADLNGDGYLDLISDGPSVYFNLGNADFGPTNYLGAGADMTRAEDVDQDGDLDLISSRTADLATRVEGYVRVLLNDGKGRFTNVTATYVGREARSIATGDLNGDGYPDAVLIGDFASISVALNRGDGIFDWMSSVPTSNNITSLALADLDNDGDLDVAAATGNGLNFFLNNGRGRFSAGPNSPQPLTKAAARIITADLDNDGDADLVTIAESVCVYRNSGRGEFTLEASFPITRSGFLAPEGVTTGDVDGDGDLDLLMAGGTTGGRVQLRLNNGQGQFSAATELLISTASYPMMSGVALADLDKDGDLDMAAADFGFGGLHVRLNQVASFALTSFAPRSGPVGTTVTLTGTKLDEVTTILLNGTKVVAFTLRTPNTLELTVPTGATTGPITLLAAGGTTSSVQPFNVTALTASRQAHSGSVSIYPNPVRGAFTITVQNPVSDFRTSRAELVDNTGKVLAQLTRVATAHPGTLAFLAPAQAPGLYILRLYTVDGVVTKRLAVH